MLLLPAETFLLRVFGIYVPILMCIIWGYIYILYAFMFSLTNISGTVCSKKRHFEYILKKTSICHVYLWKPLKISSCLALFILISSHGVAAKPGTWVAANVTGRFTARTFHSHKLAGVFGRKKRSCVRVNLIFKYRMHGLNAPYQANSPNIKSLERCLHLVAGHT